MAKRAYLLAAIRRIAVDLVSKPGGSSQIISPDNRRSEDGAQSVRQQEQTQNQVRRMTTCDGVENGSIGVGLWGQRLEMIQVFQELNDDECVCEAYPEGI
jgi:hypothetical protein